jgi:predicted uridylate kinase
MATFVVKVGGSYLSPSADRIFDFERAKDLYKTLIPFIEKGDRFIINVGGGYQTRLYQQMLRDNNIGDYDQHYVGTAVCNLNSIILRGVFGSLAENDVVTFNDFQNLENIEFKRSVLIAGAEKPGVSSDYNASTIAIHFGIKDIISMKNINGVYTADPKVDLSAVKLDNISWDKYFDIIGRVSIHQPGGHLPVDPHTVQLAKMNGLRYYIFDGAKINNLKNIILNKPFDGTIIS